LGAVRNNFFRKRNAAAIPNMKVNKLTVKPLMRFWMSMSILFSWQRISCCLSILIIVIITHLAS